METRARKRARLSRSLAYLRWLAFHLSYDVEHYDFRLYTGYETVWCALCDFDNSSTSEVAYVQIAQLSLPGSVRLPQLQ